jgi:ribosome-binding protein aMBF1 (putative translation factor)
MRGARLNYARAIKEARLTYGISKAELADRIKCDSSFISHLEAGRRNPSIETVDAIARACLLSAAHIHRIANQG